MAQQSKSRFRHEDVASVPKGWRVRTISHDRHRVRVAFPPGRRERGSGRLISILHPIGENPCAIKASNPAELVIMSGMNPPKRRFRVNAPKGRILASENLPIGTTTLQAFDRGEELEKLYPGTKAYFTGGFSVGWRIDMRETKLNPAELVVMSGVANPHVAAARNGNPADAEQAAEIHERFVGRETRWIDVSDEPHMSAGNYAGLGDLLELTVKPSGGGPVESIDFADDGGLPQLVADTQGKLWFVGGNQDISDQLDHFTDEETQNRGLVTLGEARRIDYRAAKWQTNFKDQEWTHNFGEESGVRPLVQFDQKTKRLLLSGGNYRIEAPGIID